MLPATLEPAPIQAAPTRPNFRPFISALSSGRVKVNMEGAQESRSLFKVSPNAMRRALHQASMSLSDDPVLVDAIFRIRSEPRVAADDPQGPPQAALPNARANDAWATDIWTVAISETHFINMPMRYRRSALRTVIKRVSDGRTRTIANLPQSVLLATIQHQRYLCVRATYRLGQADEEYLASNILVMGTVSQKGSFIPVEA